MPRFRLIATPRWQRSAITLLLIAGTLLGATTASAGAAPVNLDSAAAIHLVSSTQLSPRLFQLTMTTPALDDPVEVDVLLPTDYATSSRRYPVLYLLHGTNEDQSSWTSDRDTVAVTAALPMIVVMPDGGLASEYANWVSPDHGMPPPQWETFHVQELIPWIDAHYRTLAERSERAIAGESMGGLGTMEYAARFPELFSVAASFSGAVSLVSPVGRTGVSVVNEAGVDLVAPGTIYGDYATDQLNWRAHSPPDLATNLGSTRLLIYAHNGIGAGVCSDGDLGGNEADATEVLVHEVSEEFVVALARASIPYTWDDLGDGTHDNGCFDQELSLALPEITAEFDHPTPAPTSVSYTSTDPTWSQWGWTVAMSREVNEFSTLKDASATGFALYGSGSATVQTPPRYTPGSAYTVTTSPSLIGEPGASGAELGCPEPLSSATLLQDCLPNAAVAPYLTTSPLQSGPASSSTVVADDSGRMTLPVPLGPSNQTQEFADGTNRSTLIYRTTVAIAASAPRAGCPAVTGTLHGRVLGRLALGMTRARARAAYVHSSDRRTPFSDAFCLTPTGVRAGYASPALLRHLPASAHRRVMGRVVWAATASGFYALDGVRPGETLASARARVHLTGPVRVGANGWYLAANGSSVGLLRVDGATVTEVAITAKPLTIGRARLRALLSSVG